MTYSFIADTPFKRYIPVAAAPWGRFPDGPAYDVPPGNACSTCVGDLGAYYQNRSTLPARAGFGEVSPVGSLGPLLLAGVFAGFGYLLYKSFKHETAGHRANGRRRTRRNESEDARARRVLGDVGYSQAEIEAFIRRRNAPHPRLAAARSEYPAVLAHARSAAAERKWERKQARKRYGR